ncbi:hypothetical protein [Streptomyces sp. ML-6]|uniref:hypothetical protein n=1 Tax=Streptomyces sp. ML-6 TaxID=2982693 RepID=UPI0024BF34E5|nr:hypothetical protein [Streptomyces sp. ML-6]MDK0520375.1 hypothetical protein [Streptomyces sp. ML-6]
MSEYRDVQSAVRTEKFRIWLAWLAGGIGGAIICNALRDIEYVNSATQILWAILGILATITAVRMTNALNRRANAARREVLGDDM